MIKDFLILYENKNRELESDVLLAEIIRSKGYTVDIKHVVFSKRNHDKYKVLIVPWAYSNDDLYFLCKKYGRYQKIINLRWEQVFFPGDFYNVDAFMYPHEEAKKCFCVAWGEKEAAQLCASGVSSINIIPCGAMHLDFLKDKNLYMGKKNMAKSFNLDINKKWILFVSSFSWTNKISKKDTDYLINKIGKSRLEYKKLSLESKKQILNWFKKFLSEHDDYIVIYRPHPSEFTDSNLNSFHNQYNNFIVCKDLAINEWIYSCDYVFNWNSTTAIQSILLNKGNILLRPIKIGKTFDFEMFKNDPKISSYESFVKIFENDIDSCISEYKKFYYIDDNYSSLKLAQSCIELLNSNYTCDVDYDKVVKTVHGRTTIRNRINNYIYNSVLVPLFIKKEFHFKRGTKLDYIYSSFKGTYDNKATREEYSMVMKKVSKFINECDISL